MTLMEAGRQEPGGERGRDRGRGEREREGIGRRGGVSVDTQLLERLWCKGEQRNGIRPGEGVFAGGFGLAGF